MGNTQLDEWSAEVIERKKTKKKSNINNNIIKLYFQEQYSYEWMNGCYETKAILFSLAAWTWMAFASHRNLKTE